jgi:hypothetical protein
MPVMPPDEINMSERASFEILDAPAPGWEREGEFLVLAGSPA